uniref:Purinergic receptor P2Y13 n=1 Tax=Leptobrachium leishanense TaxID=445787 RepID=A0A8C5MH02_9ANUR
RELFSNNRISIQYMFAPINLSFFFSPAMNTDASNNSNASSLFPTHCHRDTRIAEVVFPILYSIVFFFGIIMNSLSLWIFCHVPNNTVFIIYLKNTLAADIIMTLTLPFKILTDSGLASWKLKAVVCRYSAVIFYETMYINIILLGLIGLDRFLKIARPLENTWMKKKHVAKWISVAVWLSVFGLSLPNMVLSHEKATPSTVRKCANLKNSLGLKWHAAVNYICQFIFWSVFLSMIIFYTIITKKVYQSYANSRSRNCRTRRNTKARVFIVVVVFFVCFAPYHFSRIPYTFSQTGLINKCSMQNKLFIAKETTLWIATTNVCIDPLIYVLLCKPFRKLITDVIVSRNTNMETQIINESTL